MPILLNQFHPIIVIYNYNNINTNYQITMNYVFNLQMLQAEYIIIVIVIFDKIY